MPRKGISGWAALGIAVLVVLAAGGIYHTVDVRNDLKDALQSEYAAVDLYDELDSQEQRLFRRPPDNVYVEIALDEVDHIKRLEKYISADSVNNTYEVSIEGAIQSERDAIAQYQELINKIYLYRGLKEDLQHILEDEKAHLNMLQSKQAGPTDKLSEIIKRS